MLSAALTPLILLIALPAQAASQTELSLVAPDGCASAADLLDLVNVDGAPPDVKDAVLRIQPDTDGYITTLQLQDAGVYLEDKQASRTCSAALAWGAFSWNNLFTRIPAVPADSERGIDAESKAAMPAAESASKRSLRVAIGANTIFGLAESFRETDISPGASASVSADFEPVRIALLGSYLAPSNNAFPGASPTTRQRIGAELCAVSGSTESRLRGGACAGLNMNFIQFHVPEQLSQGSSSAHWWDVHAAVLGNLRLTGELELQARLAAAVSPESVNLTGPHGAPPPVRYVLEPMLLLAYAFDLSASTSVPSRATNQRARLAAVTPGSRQ